MTLTYYYVCDGKEVPFLTSCPPEAEKIFVDYVGDDIPNFRDGNDLVFYECKVIGRWFDSSHNLKATLDLKEANAFLAVTQSLKNFSKCTRLKVCCIITKNGRIVSTGLNGTPKGFPNCSQMFTVRDCLAPDYQARHHNFSEAYEVHAEMNAVLELGKNSSIGSYENLTLYCSTCPCPNCAKMIAQAGIKNVVYAEAYDRNPGGGAHLLEFGINVFQC